MTITLHEDVIGILRDQAADLGVTLDEAANFLIRFGTFHKPLVVEREMLILDVNGERIYDYAKMSGQSEIAKKR